MTEQSGVFSEEISVKSYDSDMFREMSLPALMRYLQEIAGHHLTHLGLPFEKLYADHAVFLLSCMEIHIYNPIPLWQELLLETWSYGIKGATFTRNNRIKTQKGEIAAEASAGWFLVDPESHHIIRPKSYAPIQAIPSVDIPVLSNGHLRIARPDSAQKVCDRKVVFSDADYNRHLNNTKYAEILTDLCTQELETSRIKNFRIVYAGEAKCGETIEIFRQDNCFFGTKNQERCFEAEIEFEKR